MKVNLPKIKNIFKVESEFASIETIDKSGRIIYQIGYFADIANAILNDAITLRVTAYANNPSPKHSIFDGVKTSSDLTKNILLNSSRMKTKISTRDSTYLARINSDISAGVNNSIAAKIKKNPDKATQLIGNKKIVQYIKKESRQKFRTRTSPNLSVSMMKTEVASRKPVSLKKTAVKAIIQEGVDPSVVGDLDFPVISPEKSLSGTVIEPGIGSKMPSRQPATQVKKMKASMGFSGAKMGPSRIRAVKRAERIIPKVTRKFEKSPVSKKIKQYFSVDIKKKSPPSPAAPPPSEVIIREVPARWKEYIEELPVQIEKLNGVRKIYILLELIGAKGEIIDSEVRRIDHEKLLKEYYTPHTAPDISIGSSKLGVNVINCTQVDPKATSILLYRKTLNPLDSSIGKSYKLLAKLDVTIDDASAIYADRVNNTLTCVYRAIALGPMGIKSDKFNNVIAKALPHPGVGTKSVTPAYDLTHASIFAETMGDKVRVRVTNIPDGPCALYVIAEDLTQKSPPRIVGDDETQKVRVVDNKSLDMFFNDIHVKPGHLYRYVCKLIFPNGKEVLSPGDEIHQFLYDFETDNVVMTINDPIVTVDENSNISVAISTAANFTEEGLNSIIGALSDAGIESEFTSDISKNRGKLSGLLAISVERQDTISGETESYGIIQSKDFGAFVDNVEYRKIAGVSELKPGRMYKYIFTLLIRDPGSLFPQAEEKETDITTDRSYSVLVAKFLNPLVLKHGTLPSTSRVKGLSDISGLVLKDPFLEGKTSISEVVDVVVPSQRTVVKNVGVRKGPRGNSIVSWSISGDPNEVDHFVVLAEYEGTKSAIGVVHSITESTNFEFIDLKLSNSIGVVKYSLNPVFSDYTYGAESNSVFIVNEVAYPEFSIME